MCHFGMSGYYAGASSRKVQGGEKVRILERTRECQRASLI